MHIRTLAGMTLPRNKTVLLWALLIVPLLLCFGLVFLAPEPDLRHARGLVVLNVSGYGYSQGNVVWLSSPDRCGPDDIVLYDWRTINPLGMRPALALGRYADLAAVQKQYIIARLSFRLGHNFLKGHAVQCRVY